MRHTYVTRYDPDQYELFFEELKSKGYIAEEYDYINCSKTRKKTATGTILSVTDKGRKFTAIASNVGKKIRTYKYRHAKTIRTRTMYRLTDEGVQYLKELIVEERI